MTRVKLVSISICLLKASIKTNVKIAEDQIVQGMVLATRTCHTFLLGLEKNLLLGLVVT